MYPPSILLDGEGRRHSRVNRAVKPVRAGGVEHSRVRAAIEVRDVARRIAREGGAPCSRIVPRDIVSDARIVLPGYGRSNGNGEGRRRVGGRSKTESAGWAHAAPATTTSASAATGSGG